PTPRQRPFIEAVLRGTPATVLFATRNRSGKTIAAAYCGAMLARFGMNAHRAAWSSGGDIAVWERATAGWVVSLDYAVGSTVVQPLDFDNGAAARGAAVTSLLGEWLPGVTGPRAYAAFERSLHVAPAPPVSSHLPLCWT